MTDTNPTHFYKTRLEGMQRAIAEPIAAEHVGAHDIERIADHVLSWDEEKQAYYLNCSAEDFWYIVQDCRLETCTFPGCDDEGRPVLAERHGHAREVGTFAGTQITLANEAGDGWEILEIHTAPTMSPDDARELAYGLMLAAADADSLNQPRQVRRPIDHCAEPDLDGIGGL